MDALASSRHPLFRTAIKLRTETRGLLRRILLASTPGRGLIAVYRKLAHRRLQRALSSQDLKSTFTRYALDNHWGNDQSLSGAGSTLEATANLRAALPDLITSLGVRTIFDAPCGDFHWFRHVPLPAGVTYIGADVVDELVESNRRAYGSDIYSFRSIDITSDPLPRADLWHCRDVLFHLSDRDIFRALQRFAESEIEYLLTTSLPEATRNQDILTGDFRSLNLRLAPFNFPEPELWIDDSCPGLPVRRMGLWRRAAVLQVLASAPR
jgi:hypothetical protein